MRTQLRTLAKAAVIAVAATAVLAAQAPAYADGGGNGNPLYDCPNGITVASSSIYDYDGHLVGKAEMRWSRACSGNWTRTTSYIGSQYLYSTISKDPFDGLAWGGEDYGTQNWSPYMRVAATQPMCSYGQIRVNMATYVTHFCAS